MFIKNHSLFGFGHSLNPACWLDTLLNPYKYTVDMIYREHPVSIKWTQRAQAELEKLNQPLVVEMQLYFSCVVKKRVLFHTNTTLESTPVNEHFGIALQAVEAAACDPVEFVNNFPAKRVLDSAGTQKVHPGQLQFDFKNNQWLGEFTL